MEHKVSKYWKAEMYMKDLRVVSFYKVLVCWMEISKVSNSFCLTVEKVNSGDQS